MYISYISWLFTLWLSTTAQYFFKQMCPNSQLVPRAVSEVLALTVTLACVRNAPLPMCVGKCGSLFLEVDLVSQHKFHFKCNRYCQLSSLLFQFVTLSTVLDRYAWHNKYIVGVKGRVRSWEVAGKSFEFLSWCRPMELQGSLGISNNLQLPWWHSWKKKFFSTNSQLSLIWEVIIKLNWAECEFLDGEKTLVFQSIFFFIILASSSGLSVHFGQLYNDFSSLCSQMSYLKSSKWKARVSEKIHSSWV